MVEEYATRAPLINQKFLTISDHGMLGAIPRQIKACEKMNDKKGKDTLSPIFACELYVNRLQPEANGLGDMQKFMAELNEDEKDECKKSSHLLAIAYNEVGYKNLVRLSSWSWTKGFYRRPRVNYEQLQKHKEGLFFTSCCYNSEVGRAFDRHGEDAAFAMIERYIEMFGKEHYLLEIMLLDFKKQKPYDAFIIKAKEKYGLKMVLTNDCLVDGTLVWTQKGFRFIEDVVIGDKVLTHKDRYQKVEYAVSRKIRPDEQVYRVSAKVGTYCFEATGNHKIRVANNINKIWFFDWKETKNLSNQDYLLVPKVRPEMIFSDNNIDYIDLLNFIDPDEYQVGSGFANKGAGGGNFSCRLQYHIDKDLFVSFRGFDRSYKTEIPRFLKVDDDLLKIIGWYISEGWSETKKLQVGFALHASEQPVADFIINYFAQFGIIAKTYQVSKNGIAVRFSSKVFNRFFSKLCGQGSNNKHLPRVHDEWLKVWSQDQLKTILSTYWLGDGCGNEKRMSFNSTSKILIYEISTVLNAFGICSLPSVREYKNSNWKYCWCLHISGDRSNNLLEWFNGASFCSVDLSDFWIDLGDCYAVRLKEIKPIEFCGFVHDLQVQKDHSFVANLIQVSNCHYCQAEDSHFQRLMLMVQTGRTLDEIKAAIAQDQMQDFFELQDANLWMKSEEELNEKWLKDYRDIIPYELFCEAKRTTVEICNKAKGVQLDRSLKLPILPDADENLKEEVMKGFANRGLPKNKEYLNRVKEEYSLITRKGFSSYFLIQKMMTDEARRVCGELLGFGDGSQAVGPGRGSGVGSLICYCLGITSVDPVYEGLLFSRFMSEARGGRSIILDFRNMNPLPPEESFQNDKPTPIQLG